ncbi:M81 family metallopeptidase, partial [archaeon]|nr:M81 family metallopeptidase [archaeon]
MEKKYKVAIAGFQHESNSFSPKPTEYDDFLKSDGWPGLTLGEYLMGEFATLNLPLSGFIQAASDTCQLTPICWSSAEPYGPVSKDAFERMIELICNGVRGAGEIDAVYLDLHGAMVCEHCEDGEGEIIARVRGVVGPDMPLSVSLDLHANVTPEMVALSDTITIYRTYPHLDMADTGKRSYDLLMHMLRTKTKPHKAFRQLSFLMPLSSQHTGSGPCQSFYDGLPAMINEGVTSIDFATGFPPSDIWHCGPAIVAYGPDVEAVEGAAGDLYDKVALAEINMKDPLLSIDEAVELAISRGSTGAPAIIADVQDNPGAGGSGDTTGLLHALIAKKARGVVLSCFWDAEAVTIAQAAGEGSTVSLSLGGKSGPDEVKPLQAKFIVETLSNGIAMCEGEMLKGFELDLGPTVLLRVKDEDSDIRIVVSTERAQCLDQAFFRVVGVEPVEQSILVVKSTVHYRADFEAFASELIMCASPGYSYCRL